MENLYFNRLLVKKLVPETDFKIAKKYVSFIFLKNIRLLSYMKK